MCQRTKETIHSLLSVSSSSSKLFCDTRNMALFCSWRELSLLGSYQVTCWIFNQLIIYNPRLETDYQYCSPLWNSVNRISYVQDLQRLQHGINKLSFMSLQPCGEKDILLITSCTKSQQTNSVFAMPLLKTQCNLKVFADVAATKSISVGNNKTSLPSWLEL